MSRVLPAPADHSDAAASSAPAAVRRTNRGRLFRKYLLLILTLVMTALLVSGAVSIYFTYQENKAALATLQHEKALAAAARIEQYVGQIEQQLAYAALPQLDAGDVELRRIEFLKLLRQAPEVTDIAQIDAAGREQIAVSRLGMDNINSGKDRSAEPAFQNARKGRAWYGPVYFRKETEPYMTIALRSGSDKGPVTVAEVNLKFIWDVVSRIKIGEKGKAYVVDDSGFLIADPDIGLVLRKTSLSQLPHVKAALEGRSSDELAMVSKDLAGTAVLTAMAPIESLRWDVFVEQPVAEVYAKLNASIVRTGLLLLVGLVISAAAAFVLARGMVRPIRILEEGAERIGAGNLDQRIDVRTGDELEALADRFNRMTAQLRESYAGLERKVEERTRELQSSLEQQTAISEILRVISSSPTDVQPVLDAVAERAAQLCDSPFARVILVDGNELRGAAHFSTNGSIGTLRPAALKRTSINGRAVLDRQTVHHADIRPLLDSEFPDAKPNIDRDGTRAVLAVPLMREGGAYGSIFVFRREAGLFAPAQVSLIETFARQAAIAIDNVRLFNETKESLDQQTAISEILRVISGSPSDLQPVFDTILAHALALCEGDMAVMWRYDGSRLRVTAHRNTSASGLAHLQQHPLELGTYNPTPRAALERRIIQEVDVFAHPEYRPLVPRGETVDSHYSSTVLAVPLLKEAELLGVITIWRLKKVAFTEKQIALVKTFADQAAIAIENVRLFAEVQARTRELQESLEYQTATSEVLNVISRSPSNIEPVLDAIAETAQRLCQSEHVFIMRLSDGLYHVAVAKNATPEQMAYLRANPFAPDRGSVTGRVALEGRTIQIDDVLADPEYTKTVAGHRGFRTNLGVPLLREGVVIGVIVLTRSVVQPFAQKQIDLLTTFADQAVIAIENVRLFNETKEALEQQTAIAEILRVISGSPTDVLPVLDAIAERAARLCDASAASMYLIEGNALRHLASKGPSPDPVGHVDTLPIDRDSVSGRALLERRTIEIGDMLAEGADYPRSYDLARKFGHRTVVVIPLVREGQPFGTILLRRAEVRRFSDREIALLRTFGDQAAIALQNVRLFNETKEALEQQRASGEVLAAISNSIADTQPVFETILASCERLFNGKIAVIDLVGEDGLVHLGAYHGPRREDVKQVYPHTLEPSSATGAAIARRSVVHYANWDQAPQFARRAFGVFGVKAAIGAPMLWEGKGIGAIWVVRDHAGPFSEKEIALLKTFADQAVIAIQNARLFREIQDKSAQLEIANKHKSEFLANMSHELRTPLNAIIGFSEVLIERLFGDLNEKQDDYLKDIHSSGKHLLTLINDILDLSKVEAGRMELELSTFELASALTNAMTLVRERAQRHGIALGQQVDPALGEILADERKFKQILLNLLSNAVKFTPDGGRIDVRAARQDGNAVIAVHDTGIGIAPEDQAAVFEEFRQVGSDYTKKQEGTGLGLALTKKFVELHGGRIWLESEPGKGSTFTFSIPTQR